MSYSLSSSMTEREIYYLSLSSFPQAIFIVDEDLRVVFANEKSLEAFELTKDVIGQYFWEVYPESKHNGFLEYLAEGLDTEETKPYFMKDVFFETSTGYTLCLDVSIHSFTGSDQRKYVTITVIDITHQHHLKQVLNEKAFKLDAMIQSIGEPLIVFNQRGEREYENVAFRSLFSEQPYLPMKMEDWNQHYHFFDFKGNMLEPERLPIDRALQGDFAHNFEMKMIHKETHIISFYLVSVTQIQMDHESESHFLMMMSDVTNELKGEQSRNNFIQIAAHELRTPLTSIKGFTQLVLERYKEREKKWFFQPTMNLLKEIERDRLFFNVIMDEAIKLDELTNELLSISKIDQGKFEIDLQECDLAAVVEEAINECKKPNNSHVIRYHNRISSSSTKVDYKQIKRVVHNLLTNAIKYSPHSAEIQVSLDRKGNHLQCSIQDHGIGIPEEQQSRIFERFFRAHSDKHEQIHGFGVGLYICREIILSHGGKLDFCSKFGEGSTFYFTLPEDKQSDDPLIK